jgi:hypothetical protein
VVDPLFVQDTGHGGAKIGQPSRLGVDSLPAGLDRKRAPAAGVDVDMDPVLDRLGFQRELAAAATSSPGISAVSPAPISEAARTVR